MKKLIAMLGAVAMAFGLYADGYGKLEYSPTGLANGTRTIVGYTDDVTKSYEDAGSVVYWWADGCTADDFEQPAVVSNGDNYAYLQVETEGTPMLRAFNQVEEAALTPQAIEDHGLFVDTMVQVTGFESAPELKTDNTNKLLVWLKAVEEEKDGDVVVVPGSTNLMVTCGYLNGQTLTATNYALVAKADGADLGIKPGDWVQLTIRANQGTENIPTFNIYVNQNQVKAIVDEDYIVDFPSLIGGKVADLALAAAGFEGSGSISNVNLYGQANAPAWAADPTVMNIVWDANVESITIDDVNVIADKTSPLAYAVPFGEPITATIAYKQGYRKSSVTGTGANLSEFTETTDGATFTVAQYATAADAVLTVVSERDRDEATLTVDGQAVPAAGTSLAGILNYINANYMGESFENTKISVTLGDADTLNGITLDGCNYLANFEGEFTLDLNGNTITCTYQVTRQEEDEPYVFDLNCTALIKDSVGGGSIVAAADMGCILNSKELTLDAVADKDPITYVGLVKNSYINIPEVLVFTATLNVNGGLFSVKPTTGAEGHLDDGINTNGKVWAQDPTTEYWYLSAAEPPAPTAYFPTEASVQAGYTDQDGTAAKPFIIMDADDIVAIAEDTDAAIWATKSFKIADEADATLTIANPFTISADYTGTFDGNGREIVFTAKKGVAGSDDCYAFFCKLNGATIKNVTFNGTVAGDKKLLAIVAAAAGGTVTFEDVITKGSVTCCYSAGGFVCRADAGTFTFTRCVNKADVTMNSYNGDGTKINSNLKGAGFVTYPKAANTYTFTGCQNEGDVSVSGDFTFQAAGFFAYSNLSGGELITFNSCTNIGDITAIELGQTASGDALVSAAGFVAHSAQVAADSAVVFNDVVNTGAITYELKETRVSGISKIATNLSGINADVPNCTLNGVQSLGAITVIGEELAYLADTFSIGALSAANAEPTIGAGDIVTRADVPAVAVACADLTYGVVNGGVVNEFVAANALAVGGEYVVLAPGATSTIELANENDAITFTGVCEFDDTGITVGGAGLEIKTSGEGTVTYTAVLKEFDITFTDGADWSKVVKTTYGEMPVAPVADVPAKTGYTFSGWDKTIVVATEAATYTAQYTVKTDCTVTFDTDGGTAFADQTYTFGTPFNLNSYTGTKTDFEFGGWTNTVAGGAVIANGAQLTADVESYSLKAVWIAAKPEYPSYIPTGDDALKAKWDAWATGKTIANPEAIEIQEAFLLNCDPADLTTAKENFKFTAITVDGEGNVTTTVAEGTYNGYLVIQGKADIANKAEEWHAKTTGDKFFQAVLTPNKPE